MARGYSTRKLEVWAMHGHIDGGEFDYGAFFRDVMALPISQRQYAADDRAVVISEITMDDSLVRVSLYEGPTDEQPIILDVAAGSERETPLEPGEIVATKTHALLDLGAREAIVEYNHRGAKAGDLAAALGIASRQIPRWSTAWVDLAPKVERGFVEAIDDFERIRVASLRAVQPNHSWEEWRATFGDVAEDSNAGSASAEFNARRGQSLASDRGIVRFIKDRANDAASAIKSAAVVGTRAGEAAETRVTTRDHKTHTRVSVRLDDSGHVIDEAIDARLDEYHQAREAEREGDGDEQ